MSIRIKNIAQKCADCQSMRPYADYFICGMPETNPDKAQMDVSTCKVDPNTKPDWCPIDKVNASLKNLTEDQELAVKGMSVLFGAQGAFEDDDRRELARIVRCKDCKHRDPEDGKCDSGHAIQWQLPRPDDWFCADGNGKICERMKLDMDKFKIGDEVQFKERPTTKFVLTCVDKDGKLAGIGYDGVAFVDKNPDKWEKTGRYFEEAVSLMNAMADRR